MSNNISPLRFRFGKVFQLQLFNYLYYFQHETELMESVRGTISSTCFTFSKRAEYGTLQSELFSLILKML